MRRETERFDDGRQTVRCFDESNRLVRIETYASDEALKAAIDYLYDANGHNIERIVRNAAGDELRRMHFDADGNEIPDPDAGPVRWAAMDGSDEGLDPKGEERLSNPPQSTEIDS
jgi:hypothetical protein